jgi:hypothetical protein
MIKQKLLFYPRVDKIISKLKICQVLRFVDKSVKNLNNFNTIKGRTGGGGVHHLC